MNLLLDDLEELLQTHDENECIEFKEAKADFSFDKLAKYCAALSNEGGGRLILGVTDKKPRLVVGTQAFADLNRCKLSLAQKLRQRIDIQEMEFPQGRVLIFHAPARPRGDAIEKDYSYRFASTFTLDVPVAQPAIHTLFHFLSIKKIKELPFALYKLVGKKDVNDF